MVRDDIVVTVLNVDERKSVYGKPYKWCTLKLLEPFDDQDTIKATAWRNVWHYMIPGYTMKCELEGKKVNDRMMYTVHSVNRFSVEDESGEFISWPDLLKNAYMDN
jgi:hypothetical protein